jgi:hypothetical protein
MTMFLVDSENPCHASRHLLRAANGQVRRSLIGFCTVLQSAASEASGEREVGIIRGIVKIRT